jgi:hypothetical protein
MMTLLVIAVIVVVVARSRRRHRHRRAVELHSAQANRQPLTEWTARYPKGVGRRRRGGL